MNLIDNAVDASPANQTVGIQLHPQPVDNQWKIEIIDYGSGIEKSQLDVIFEPFYTSKEVGLGHRTWALDRAWHYRRARWQYRMPERARRRNNHDGSDTYRSPPAVVQLSHNGCNDGSRR